LTPGRVKSVSRSVISSRVDAVRATAEAAYTMSEACLRNLR
jgi:hypothetical protein